ncbi:hypothetical protein [Pseudomonas fluorescens]|uniref:Uncharacterized protein n=1 Tax=Pseudomonas fluorescens TaxID=294 RepID=A0A5E7DCM7_PSEFL|nr:hypothetical protein [Pseudomonas fluorescens]VVO15110.1 hypothetical protein PS723_03743 [Pseudomonas fluorescens]
MTAIRRPSNKRLLVLSVVSLFGLQSCANIDSGSYNPTSWSGSDWMKCGLAIAAGAAAGAAVSGSKDRGAGALIGTTAGIAVCFVINSKTVQTQTSEQVEEQYKTGGKKITSEPQVVSYQTSIKPGSTIKRGEPMQIVSNIVVIDGSSQSVNEIKEHVRLFEPGATTPLKEGTKVANQKPGSGGYENTFTVNLDKQVPQGVYRVETSVLLNGKTVNTRSNDVQLVMIDTDTYQLAYLD